MPIPKSSQKRLLRLISAYADMGYASEAFHLFELRLARLRTTIYLLLFLESLRLIWRAQPSMWYRELRECRNSSSASPGTVTDGRGIYQTIASGFSSIIFWKKGWSTYFPSRGSHARDVRA
jgi:hypothetical protein